MFDSMRTPPKLAKASSAALFRYLARTGSWVPTTTGREEGRWDVLDKEDAWEGLPRVVDTSTLCGVLSTLDELVAEPLELCSQSYFLRDFEVNIEFGSVQFIDAAAGGWAVGVELLSR